MKTAAANTSEEVKYVYQADGPLLVPKKNGAVYQETTVVNPIGGAGSASMNKQERCWRGHLFSRLRFVVSILAIVACVIVVIVMLTNSIKSSNQEQAQEEEIAKLKETVDAQQTRLHRMQKELQFLVTRQQAYDAREDSLRRRQMPIASATSGTGTGSNIWPSPAITSDKIIQDEDDEADDTDPDMPMIPRQQAAAAAADDVDKLPRASPNKKRGKGGASEFQSSSR